MSFLRKLIHFSMAVIPLVGWLASFELAVALAAACLLASLAAEVARRWWPWVNQWLWRSLPTVFRDWEFRQVLGSTWFTAGMLLTLLLFGRDVGGTAVLFAAWGDPLAELVGRRWGKPGQGKTFVGSLGCVAGCLIAAAVGIWLGHLPLWVGLAGAIAATAVERWAPHPGDNLWMPLLSGLFMFLVRLIPGV